MSPRVAPHVPLFPGRFSAVDSLRRASCPFEYAAGLTEVMLLGIVALRAGRKIYYDGANMRITNALQANHYLRREYLQGWSTQNELPQQARFRRLDGGLKQRELPGLLNVKRPACWPKTVPLDVAFNGQFRY